MFFPGAAKPVYTPTAFFEGGRMSRVLKSRKMVMAALAALDEGAFDAVVTDVAMPEMDGLDLARDIRARGLDVPILFVSGNADHDRLRGEAVLDKPFTHDSLARKLDELLAGRPPAHRRAAECR